MISASPFHVWPIMSNNALDKGFVFVTAIIGCFIFVGGPLIAMFPGSPPWSWEMAKIGILVLNILTIFFLAQRNIGSIDSLYMLLSALSLLAIFVHFAAPVITFHRYFWQFLDAYCLVAFARAFYYMAKENDKRRDQKPP